MTYFRYADLAVGQPLLTVRHTITAELVRQFAAATGDGHPWHLQGAPPFAEPIGHPALVTIFATAVLGRAGIDRPPGDIHARHEYELLAPLRLDRTITTSGVVVDKYEKRGRKFVVFTTSSVDDTGVEVARCRVTIAMVE